AANVIGALVIVHLTPVPFVDQGGWELVAALAAGALLIAAAGPGRFSIDRLLFGRRSSLSPTRAADPRDELRAPPGHAQEPALRDAASSEGRVHRPAPPGDRPRVRARDPPGARRVGTYSPPFAPSAAENLWRRSRTHRTVPDPSAPPLRRPATPRIPGAGSHRAEAVRPGDRPSPPSPHRDRGLRTRVGAGTMPGGPRDGH